MSGTKEFNTITQKSSNKIDGIKPVQQNIFNAAVNNKPEPVKTKTSPNKSLSSENNPKTPDITVPPVGSKTKLKTANNLLTKSLDFGKTLVDSLAYNAYESPMLGLSQIVKTATNVNIEKYLPQVKAVDPGKFGTSNWYASQIGSGLGIALDFMLTDKLMGSKIGNLANTDLATSATTQIIGRSAVSGAIYEGVFSPSNLNSKHENLLTARVKQAFSGALTFGAMAGISNGLGNLTASLNDQNILAKAVNNNLVNGIVSGSIGGIVNVNTDSLLNNGHLASLKNDVQTAYAYSVAGIPLGLAHVFRESNNNSNPAKVTNDRISNDLATQNITQTSINQTAQSPISYLKPTTETSSDFPRFYVDYPSVWPDYQKLDPSDTSNLYISLNSQTIDGISESENLIFKQQEKILADLNQLANKKNIKVDLHDEFSIANLLTNRDYSNNPKGDRITNSEAKLLDKLKTQLPEIYNDAMIALNKRGSTTRLILTGLDNGLNKNSVSELSDILNAKLDSNYEIGDNILGHEIFFIKELHDNCRFIFQPTLDIVSKRGAKAQLLALAIQEHIKPELINELSNALEDNSTSPQYTGDNINKSEINLLQELKKISPKVYENAITLISNRGIVSKLSILGLANNLSPKQMSNLTTLLQDKNITQNLTTDNSHEFSSFINDKLKQDISFNSLLYLSRYVLKTSDYSLSRLNLDQETTKNLGHFVDLFPSEIALKLAQDSSNKLVKWQNILSNLYDLKSGRVLHSLIVNHVNDTGHLYAADLKILTQTAKSLTNSIDTNTITTTSHRTIEPSHALANTIDESVEAILDKIPSDQTIVLLGRDMWPFYPLLKEANRPVQYFLWSRLQLDDKVTQQQWLKEIPPNANVIDTGFMGTIPKNIQKIDASINGFLLNTKDSYELKAYFPALLPNTDSSYSGVTAIERIDKPIYRTKGYDIIANKAIALQEFNDSGDACNDSQIDLVRITQANKQLLEALGLDSWTTWRYKNFTGTTPQERFGASNAQELKDHYQRVAQARKAL